MAQQVVFLLFIKLAKIHMFDQETHFCGSRPLCSIAMSFVNTDTEP